MTLVVAAASAARAVFSPVQEFAKANLDPSDMQMSLIQGLACWIPIAVFAIPRGRAVDRSNRVRLLLVMAVICTLGTWLSVIAGGFLVAATALAVLIPNELRGLCLGAFVASLPLLASRPSPA